MGLLSKATAPFLLLATTQPTHIGSQRSRSVEDGALFTNEAPVSTGSHLLRPDPYFASFSYVLRLTALSSFLQPPQVLRAADAATEQETIEIAVTRVLLKSYYDIVRKNIQDQVPKAIMHFLVSARPFSRALLFSYMCYSYSITTFRFTHLLKKRLLCLGVLTRLSCFTCQG